MHLFFSNLDTLQANQRFQILGPSSTQSQSRLGQPGLNIGSRLVLPDCKRNHVAMDKDVVHCQQSPLVRGNIFRAILTVLALQIQKLFHRFHKILQNIVNSLLYRHFMAKPRQAQKRRVVGQPKASNPWPKPYPILKWVGPIHPRHHFTSILYIYSWV